MYTDAYCMYTCMYTEAYYVYTCTYTYTCLHIVCMLVCMYTYTYCIYTCMYTYCMHNRMYTYYVFQANKDTVTLLYHLALQFCIINFKWLHPRS